MIYKNTKTGQVVKTTGKVSGSDWERVVEKAPGAAAPPAEKKSPEKKAAEKPKGKAK